MVETVGRADEGARGRDIVQTAIADGRFNTLVAALRAAGLERTLSGPGPFTVFAPTDGAFNNLPPGSVDMLLRDAEGQLKQVLLYHVIGERLVTSDIMVRSSVKTLQGGELNIRREIDTFRVNNARVIIPDIQCSNGVCHAIDMVLLPR